MEAVNHVHGYVIKSVPSIVPGLRRDISGKPCALSDGRPQSSWTDGLGLGSPSAVRPTVRRTDEHTVLRYLTKQPHPCITTRNFFKALKTVAITEFSPIYFLKKPYRVLAVGF